MSAARSRGTTSRSGKKTKDVPKSAGELKREKQQHDFAFNSEDAIAMRAEIRSMRAERDNETRVTNDCQQQKVKIDQFHELAKKEREELKMSLRNSLRQKQDLEEKQAYELKVTHPPPPESENIHNDMQRGVMKRSRMVARHNSTVRGGSLLTRLLCVARVLVLVRPRIAALLFFFLFFPAAFVASPLPPFSDLQGQSEAIITRAAIRYDRRALFSRV